MPDTQWSDEYGFGGRAKRRRLTAPQIDLLCVDPQDWSLEYVVRMSNETRPKANLLDDEDDGRSLSEAASRLMPRFLHPPQPPHSLGGQRNVPLQVHDALSARTL